MNLTTALAVALMVLAAVRARPAKNDQGEGRWWWVLIPLALLAWWPPVGFLADDFALLRQAREWTPAQAAAGLRMAGGDGAWRPVGQAVLALLERICGRSETLWSVSSLLLHGLNSLLVWRVARRLGMEEMHAALAGVLFAVHGAQSEAVAWMAGSFDRVSTLFVLAAWLAFAARREWLAGLLVMLGIASKEPAYATVALCGLWLWHEGTLRQEWRRLTPVVAGSALLLAWRLWLFGGPGGYESVAQVGALHAIKVLGWRVWGTLWFPVNWSRGASGIRLLSVALMLVGGLLWAWRARGGRSALLALGALLACCTIPLGLLPIGADLEKSRVLYLPLVWFALVLASLRPPKAAWLLMLAASVIMLKTNLVIWRDVGELTRRTCADAARCAQPARDLPRIVDGVYFLKFALKDCAPECPK